MDVERQTLRNSTKQQVLTEDKRKMIAQRNAGRHWQVLVTRDVPCNSLIRSLEQVPDTQIEIHYQAGKLETSLLDAIPNYHGWIIGDGRATARVFMAGARGLLRGAVRLGSNIDVDFDAARSVGVPVVTIGAEAAQKQEDYHLEKTAIMLIDRLIMTWKPLHID